MVTESEELKESYFNELKERLRSCPSHPELEEIHIIKEDLFKLKWEKNKTTVSCDWTMKELEDVLKQIKKGKFRDPKGISREIFHPTIIGENLRKSLPIMFNLLKQQRRFHLL